MVTDLSCPRKLKQDPADTLSELQKTEDDWEEIDQFIDDLTYLKIYTKVGS